jgi:uncharacterized protein YegL
MESYTIGNLGGTGFTYEAAGFQALGASEYTLVTIVVDGTGSTYPFAKLLREAVKTAVETCRRSPRRKNLLLRVIVFSDDLPGGSREIHGFIPLADVDLSVYDGIVPSGMTPLYDATHNAIAAMVDYGTKLADNDYPCNGIVFVITDGADNTSRLTPAAIRQLTEDTRIGEKLESLLTILIGINAAQFSRLLQAFQADANLDKYVEAGVTKDELAALADFLSTSVSLASQSLGSGGPSQNIPATI